jgi:hypothetical protein
LLTPLFYGQNSKKQRPRFYLLWRRHPLSLKVADLFVMTPYRSDIRYNFPASADFQSVLIESQARITISCQLQEFRFLIKLPIAPIVIKAKSQQLKALKNAKDI